MDYLQKIAGDFEAHSTEGIRACFENGINPNQWYKGKPLIYELINMYLRSKRFQDWAQDNELLYKKYTFNCAFTPLHEVSLLHICAEYNHLHCADILLKHGMDINIRAGIDVNGFSGQTPVFHTVNQHANACIDVMKFLISREADLKLTLSGLIWGKGYEWETFIPSVNPISYSIIGLLPQFQRTDIQIYETIAILLQACYGISYFPENVPNEYLKN